MSGYKKCSFCGGKLKAKGKEHGFNAYECAKCGCTNLRRG